MGLVGFFQPSLEVVKMTVGGPAMLTEQELEEKQCQLEDIFLYHFAYFAHYCAREDEVYNAREHVVKEMREKLSLNDDLLIRLADEFMVWLHEEEVDFGDMWILMPHDTTHFRFRYNGI